MYFKVGGFRFEDGEVQLKTFEPGTFARNADGFVDKMTARLDVEYDIYRETQAAITARYNQIFNAVRDGVDVGFYQDDGSKSAIFIDSSLTLTGVLVTQRPTVIAEDGGDYVNHLKGAFGFTADYLPSAGGGGGSGPRQSSVTAYNEVITVRGDGGPRKAIDVVDRGPPRIYVLADRTPVYASQVGSMDVVASAIWYPDPPPPLWPKLKTSEDSEIAKNYEEQSDGRFKMTLGWNYQFMSDGPLFGQPRRRQ